MKSKDLVRKFSNTGIKQLCPLKNWRLPREEEAQDIKTEHKEFWVSGEPHDIELSESHGLLYIVHSKEVLIVNKSHIYPCVVIKERKMNDYLIDMYAAHLELHENIIFMFNDHSYYIDWSCTNEGWNVNKYDGVEAWGDETDNIDGGLCTGTVKDAITFMLDKDEI